MTDEKLIQIAKDYILDKHPEWKENLSLPSVIKDLDDCWEVSFELPELTLGGVPVVMINKVTKEVDRAFHTQ